MPRADPQAKAETLDLENYFPVLLTALSNKWSGAASQLYMKRFGIGIMEWRVLSAAAAAPGARPFDVCQMVGVDKGAVAKAIRALSSRGFLGVEPDQRDGRSKILTLTTEGWRIHNQILTVALKREAILLETLSEGERGLLLDFLRRLLDRLPALKE
jgi:DNA-binding MarR family transcriptional regulator